MVRAAMPPGQSGRNGHAQPPPFGKLNISIPNGGGLPPPANADDPNSSVHELSALVTVDKADLGPPAGRLPGSLMTEIDRGLRRVLG